MADIQWLAIVAKPSAAPTNAERLKFWPAVTAGGLGVWGQVLFPVSNPAMILTEAGPNEVARRAKDESGTYTLTTSGTSMTLRIQGVWGFVEATFSSPDTLVGLDPTATGWGANKATKTLVWRATANEGGYLASATGQVSFTTADGTFAGGIKPVEILYTTFDSSLSPYWQSRLNF